MSSSPNVIPMLLVEEVTECPYRYYLRRELGKEKLSYKERYSMAIRDLIFFYLYKLMDTKKPSDGTLIKRWTGLWWGQATKQDVMDAPNEKSYYHRAGLDMLYQIQAAGAQGLFGTPACVEMPYNYQLDPQRGCAITGTIDLVTQDPKSKEMKLIVFATKVLHLSDIYLRKGINITAQALAAEQMLKDSLDNIEVWYVGPPKREKVRVGDGWRPPDVERVHRSAEELQELKQVARHVVRTIEDGTYVRNPVNTCRSCLYKSECYGNK